MPSYYNKVKFLVVFVFVFICIIFLLPAKILAYTSPADCKINVRCDNSQCSTANDRYCTGFFPDGAPCSYHESCTVSGNPSCDCDGRVGNFTYTLDTNCPLENCTGILGPNGSSRTCHYCQTPICTPGQTDPNANLATVCNPPTGCTASRTCTANYEWGACSTTCPSPPTVTLTVNNVFALTVNKGDVFALDWNIGGGSSTCTNNWGLSNAPTSGPGLGISTDSKQDAGTYVYTLTCSNSAGSDTKGVSVLVKKTCPDYNSCSACVSQDTCGWRGDNLTCQTGTSSCPANTTTWFWTDCLTNQCVCPQTTTCPTNTSWNQASCKCVCNNGANNPPTCSTTSTNPLTCSLSATCTSTTSGKGTVTPSGDGTGYDRVEWFLDGVSQGSNCSGGNCNNTAALTTSADFTVASNTPHTVSGIFWSTLGKPQVTCTSPSGSTSVAFDTTNCTTSSSTPTTTTTAPSAYQCLKCGLDSGARYYWGLDCPDLVNNKNFCSGVCSTQTEKTPNTYPQGTGNYCWLTAPESPPGPQEVSGEIWIREISQTAETKATPSFYQSASDGKIWFWFSHFPRYEGDPLPFSGHCIFKGFLNNSPTCFQENRVDASRAYIGSSDANVGRKSNSADVPLDHLKLIQWPPGYKPVRYYEYQQVQEINSRTQCASNATYTCSEACTRTDSTSIAYNCSSCGGVSCENTACSCSPTETVNDGYECRTKAKVDRELGTLTQGGFNQIASYCDPTNGNARIDLVFEKLPLLSGLVCKDNNSDGSCISGTGAARACSDGPYTLGTVTATKISTGPTFSKPVTTDGAYSMYLSSGDYNVGFSAPNVRVTSPELPRLIPNLTADTTQDFCVNPTSAWLKTTGGDVHSNTGINTPGGPQ